MKKADDLRKAFVGVLFACLSRSSCFVTRNRIINNFYEWFKELGFGFHGINNKIFADDNEV